MNSFDDCSSLRVEVQSLRRELAAYKKQFVPPGHFYSPIPSLEDVQSEEVRLFGTPPRTLPSIDLREEEQVALLQSLAAFYHEIFFPERKTEGFRYFYQNGNYSYGDAIILHSMIRRLRPKHIIEIGSGFSSCVTLDTNERFFNNAIDCTFIEPHPELFYSLLNPDDRTRICIIPQRLQDVDLEHFDGLAENDILFIDSTHVSKIGSDVNLYFFQIMPRLSPGVYVHIHDVFYPFEYPKEWIYAGRAWNEDYLLRAFLSFNDAFQIEYFASFMDYFHRDLLAEMMPLCLNNIGGNIWLKRR